MKPLSMDKLSPQRPGDPAVFEVATHRHVLPGLVQLAPAIAPNDPLLFLPNGSCMFARLSKSSVIMIRSSLPGTDQQRQTASQRRMLSRIRACQACEQPRTYSKCPRIKREMTSSRGRMGCCSLDLQDNDMDCLQDFPRSAILSCGSRGGPRAAKPVRLGV